MDDYWINRILEYRRYILFSVLLAIFFGIASILKPLEVVVGNDSTLLYQIDPIAYAKNLALTPINSPTHPQYTAANYFLLPLSIYSSFQNFIADSFSLSPTGVRLGLNIVFSIVGAYLLYSLVLRSVGVHMKAVTFPAILGAFAYGFSPIYLQSLLSPLYINDAFFVYPITLFLAIRYIRTDKPLMWGGMTILFVNAFLYVFSLSAAPWLAAFIPISAFFIIYFGRTKPRANALRILLLFAAILLSSAYYWLPQVLVFNELYGSALTVAGNFARVEMNRTVIHLNTLASAFSGIPSVARVSTINLRNTELDSWDLVLRLLFLGILVVSIVLILIQRNATDQSASNRNRKFFGFSLYAIGIYLTYLGLWAPGAQVGEDAYTWMTHIPGGSMFRDPNKWSFALAMAYGMIIAITAVRVSHARNTWLGRTASIFFILSLSVLFFKSATPLFDTDFQSAGFGSTVSPIVDRQKFRTEMKDFDAIAKQGGGLLWVPLTEKSFAVMPSGRDGGFYIGDGATGILAGIITYSGYSNFWGGHDKIIEPLEEGNTHVLVRQLQKYNIKYIGFPKLEEYFRETYLRKTAFPYQSREQAISQIQRWRVFVQNCDASRIMSNNRFDVYDIAKCTTLVDGDHTKKCYALTKNSSVVLSLLLRGSVECTFRRGDFENMIVLPVRYSSGWIPLSITKDIDLINFIHLLYVDWKTSHNIPVFEYDSSLSLGCQKSNACISTLKNLGFSPGDELRVLLVHKVHLAFLLGIFISVLTFFVFVIAGIRSSWLRISAIPKQAS